MSLEPGGGLKTADEEKSLHRPRAAPPDLAGQSGCCAL
jgi:hypothetical protein